MARLHGLSADRFTGIFQSYGFETQRIAGNADNVVFKCSKRDSSGRGTGAEFAAGLSGRNSENTFDTVFLRARFAPRSDLGGLNDFNKTSIFARASMSKNHDVMLNMDFLALGLSDASVSAHVELWFLSIGEYLRTAA